MAESVSPRTRLQQILAQRLMTVEDFRAAYDRASGDVLSERQAYRWLAGDLRTLPYPRAQAALELMFGEPAKRLLGAPFGAGEAEATHRAVATRAANSSDQSRMITMSAARARDFLTSAETTNVGPETLDQLADDVRRLAIAYPQMPLESLLDDIVSTQQGAFDLLDGRQRPGHTVELYLFAGVASGLMARASHDLGAPRDAMTHARAAYVCADNAGHDGLRLWARGLQSLIAYWSGRLEDAVRYSELDAEAAERNHSSAAVWIAAGQARSLAALGRISESKAAIERASAARESVEPDDLDDLGGLCTFSRPRQLYYSADALAWCGADEAERAERLAREALEAYEHAPSDVRAFGDEAGVRCALAIAHIEQGEAEGAIEAMSPVLELPPSQRIHGITTSVENVQRILTEAVRSERAATELAEAMRDFTTERLALPG